MQDWTVCHAPNKSALWPAHLRQGVAWFDNGFQDGEAERAKASSMRIWVPAVALASPNGAWRSLVVAATKAVADTV